MPAKYTDKKGQKQIAAWIDVKVDDRLNDLLATSPEKKKDWIARAISELLDREEAGAKAAGKIVKSLGKTTR